jgi:Zn-dependent protease
LPKRASEHPIAYLALWVVCAFFSILVHELGHVVMGRIFRARSDIVLYSMGGLAIGDFGKLARWQRILVSLAGPGAGFSLCLVAYLVPGFLQRHDQALINVNDHKWIGDVLFFLFLMNLVWNLFNLLPIIPLDGGMVMLEVVSGVLPSGGMRFAYGLSFLLAGLVAVYSLIVFLRPGLPFPPLDPLFNVIMFGMLAFSNFNTMRGLGESARPRRHSDYEEKDW